MNKYINIFFLRKKSPLSKNHWGGGKHPLPTAVLFYFGILRIVIIFIKKRDA